GTTGAIAGGALSGGITSELGGGDFLQGAALGGVGGAFNTSVADSIGSNMVKSIQDSLASSLGDQLANIVARSAASATLGAIKSTIVGTDVLTGAGLSALGSATQAAVANELDKLNINPDLAKTVAKVASNAAATGVVAAVQGQDVGQAVGSSLAMSGLQTVGETFFSGRQKPAPIEDKSTTAGSKQAALPPGYFNTLAMGGGDTMLDTGGLKISNGVIIADPIEVTATRREPGLYISALNLPEGQALFDAITAGSLLASAGKVPDRPFIGNVQVSKNVYDYLAKIAATAGAEGVDLPYRLVPGTQTVNFADANTANSVTNLDKAATQNPDIMTPVPPPAPVPTPAPTPAP
ncbi:MAG: hypothetical protein EBR82_87730, partial [Caulobacteraceae bacterium]|nr:hypothetical protein [Caulobacteraceae bacterium]